MQKHNISTKNYLNNKTARRWWTWRQAPWMAWCRFFRHRAMWALGTSKLWSYACKIGPLVCCSKAGPGDDFEGMFREGLQKFDELLVRYWREMQLFGKPKIIPQELIREQDEIHIYGIQTCADFVNDSSTSGSHHIIIIGSHVQFFFVLRDLKSSAEHSYGCYFKVPWGFWCKVVILCLLHW